MAALINIIAFRVVQFSTSSTDIITMYIVLYCYMLFSIMCTSNIKIEFVFHRCIKAENCTILT